MFKSYILKYKGFKDNKYYYYVTIIDDDFEETAVMAVSDAFAPKKVAEIIKTYSKRNLNVARNLYLFMNYVDKKYWKIQAQIKYYKTHVPEFEQYLPEINKYLLLS